MAASEIKKTRLIIVYFALMAAFLLIIGKLFYLGISGDKVSLRRFYSQTKAPKRADIVDRNGVLVATDLKTKSLYVSSALVRNSLVISRSLSGIFSDLSSEEINHKIAHGKANKGWILIRRNVTPAQEEKVKNLKIAGLVFEDDRIRVYPQRSIFSHLVGYVDLDRKGLAGIEKQYDKQLARQEEKIQIAADIRIQDILNNELENALTEYKASAASGVIIDVNTGEIIALSSMPSFDLNLQQDATDDQRFNRATNGVYELGSIFKIFTNTIAFDNNLIKLTDKFDITDPIKYGRFTIKDDHPMKGEVTVEEIFTHSSNIGTVKIAEKIGIDRQKEFFKDLGMLKKVDTEFPGLGRPIFPKIWRDINLYTISYGHGIAVTPLHIAVAASAVVNGGILYKPSFLKLDEQPKGERVIKEETSKTILELLRKTVMDGTGKFANIEGYEVGGKTGTANKVEGKGYNERQTIASFLAVFPISKPRYLVYVVVDHPNYSFNTGGMVAAPVAGRIVKNIAPILGVYPKKN